MKPSIDVQFRHLPREILRDFESKIDKSISLKIYEDKNDHFEPPADIVIYVNEHLTEVIIGGISGLLTGALWDGIKALLSKVIKRKKGNSIELDFSIKHDRTIEFSLTGDVDLKSVETIVENILEYLKDAEQQERDFANLNFKERPNEKPRIRVRYNPKTDRLELINFTVQRKENEERFKEVAKKLRS
jgi:hypothetical protein